MHVSLCASFKQNCIAFSDGYENAKSLCDLYYMNSPELLLEEKNGKHGKGRIGLFIDCS